MIALIAQAAEDPDVLAIKQTLYRTSVGSPIIASLQRAAERNKQVSVLVELTARLKERFDPVGRLNPGVEVLDGR